MEIDLNEAGVDKGMPRLNVKDETPSGSSMISHKVLNVSNARRIDTNVNRRNRREINENWVENTVCLCSVCCNAFCQILSRIASKVVYNLFLSSLPLTLSFILFPPDDDAIRSDGVSVWQIFSIEFIQSDSEMKRFICCSVFDGIVNSTENVAQCHCSDTQFNRNFPSCTGKITLKSNQTGIKNIKQQRNRFCCFSSLGFLPFRRIYRFIYKPFDEASIVVLTCVRVHCSSSGEKRRTEENRMPKQNYTDKWINLMDQQSD